MYAGQIVESDAAEQVFRDPLHPYTQVLLQSVMTPDTSLEVPELGLGTAFPDLSNPPSGCAFHPRCIGRLEGCDRYAPRAMPRPDDGDVEYHLFEDDIQNSIKRVER